MLVTRLLYGPIGSRLGKRSSRRLENCVAIVGPPSGKTIFAGRTRMFGESVRTVHIALEAAISINNEKRSRLILVTSALPQEGKKVSSVVLATALAASGLQTVLIDADLRKPIVDVYMTGASRARGLPSMLIDDEGSPVATKIDKDLYVIRGSVADESAQRAFLSTRFGTFLEAAKALFDSIFLDSPPAVVVANAAILARFAVVFLHVVRWGRTRRSVVLDAIDRLHRANGKAVSATVLNRVTPPKYYKFNRDGGLGFRCGDYYRAASATAASKP